MTILLFVLLPFVVVGLYALAVWLRNRQPTSVESGVDAFRKEMSALSPDAAPTHRRPERPQPTRGSRPPPRAGDEGNDRPDDGFRAQT